MVRLFIQVICWFAVLNLAIICFFSFIFFLISVVVWACGVLLLMFGKLLLVYIVLDLIDVSFDDINGDLLIISFRFSFFFNDMRIHYTGLLQRVVDLGISQNEEFTFFIWCWYWEIWLLKVLICSLDLLSLECCSF